jgi:VanZ family protein
MRIKPSVVLLSITIGIILFTVVYVDLPGQSMLWAEVQDAGHALIMGALAIAVLILLRQVLPTRNGSQLLPYVIALGLSALAGAGTEIAQSFLQRDAQIADFARDCLGAASFLLMYYSFDARVPWLRKRTEVTIKSLLRIASLVLFSTTLVSLTECGSAYISRNRAFPEIADFGASWIYRFATVQDADINRIRVPAGWSYVSSNEVARLDLHTGEYPGISIEEPYPDWTGKSYICLEVYSEMTDTTSLGLRIDDVHHNYADDDRYTCRLTLAPGLNRWRVSLDSVREAPATRQMDMSAIRRIILFGHNSSRPLTLYLIRFYLE